MILIILLIDMMIVIIIIIIIIVIVVTAERDVARAHVRMLCYTWGRILFDITVYGTSCDSCSVLLFNIRVYVY